MTQVIKVQAIGSLTLRQRSIAHQKLRIFPRKYIVRDARHTDLQPATQLQHQRRLSASDRTPDADRECSVREVAAEWCGAVGVVAGRIEVFVGVAVVLAMFMRGTLGLF